MRAVIDVNVWISGFLWGGIPGKVIRLAYEKRLTSYVSEELLIEMELTLKRQKFRARLVSRHQTVESLMQYAVTLSQLVDIPNLTFPELRDSEDAKILSTAVAAQAEILITGDLDLLVLKSVQGISILTPAEFLATYR